MLRERWSIRRAGLLLVAAVAPLAACGGDGGDDAPAVLRGWQREDTMPRVEAHVYDRVAVASAPGRLAWLGRGGGDTDALAYHEAGGGGRFESVELAPPTAPVGPTVTPAAAAVSGDGWVAVAGNQQEPGGLDDSLVAWRGEEVDALAPPVGDRLEPARGTTIVPDTVGAARLDDTAVVVALTGPIPPEGDGPIAPPGPEDVVTWTAAGEGGWRASQPDLAVEAPLTSARVAGDGQRLVLAGVVDGDGRLWSSTDGRSWTAVDDDALPTGVERVDLLTPVGSAQLVVAWRTDDGGNGLIVQVLDAGGLSDAGVVEPDPDSDAREVIVEGATLDDDGELVLAGTAYRPALAPVPMVWGRDGDAWVGSEQAELWGRLDYAFRAVSTAGDGTLYGLVTPQYDVDVELWGWRPPD